jgi:hypothetical protein
MFNAQCSMTHDLSNPPAPTDESTVPLKAGHLQELPEAPVGIFYMV